MPTHRNIVVCSTLLFLGLIAVAGCGGSEATNAQTVTVVQTTAPAVQETVTVVETSPAAPPETETQSDARAVAGSIEVPDVVGIDHQLAQDTMQAAGLYNLAEEDATGQGRMLLFDRNWTVVSQDPPAGAMVNEDQTITLRSKKDNE